MNSVELFLQSRKYEKNVSPKTIVWYGNAFKTFGELDISSAQALSRSVTAKVKELLERGMKPVSVRSWLTGIRAYGYWLHEEGYLKDKPKISIIKFEKKLIATLSAEQIKQVLAYKPKGLNLTRAHHLALTVLDCGLRLSEVLAITRADVDLDNMLITVKGKGGKYRRVPMSFELRKSLHRYMKIRDGYVFGTQVGTQATVSNAERDMRELGRRIGITGVRFSPHTLRHTFAVSYLRAGGNLFYLSRILGHSSVKTTELYLQSLGVEDLQKVHNGLSLLSR